jgi:hypothetical protein
MQRSEVQNIPIVSGGPVSGSDLLSLSRAVEVTNGVYTDEESDSGSLLPASHPGLPFSSVWLLNEPLLGFESLPSV